MADPCMTGSCMTFQFRIVWDRSQGLNLLRKSIVMPSGKLQIARCIQRDTGIGPFAGNNLDLEAVFQHAELF